MAGGSSTIPFLVDFIMPYCCMGNVESRIRAHSRIRAPSLDEMGIADPGPLPLTFHDKQTQVTERLISREYFKREIHEASKKQIQNPTEQSLADALTNAFRRRSHSDSS